MRSKASSAWLAPAVLCALAAGPAFGAPCESLGKLALPHVTVTSAVEVAAGAFVPTGRGRGGAAFKNLPAFCRVAAMLQPSSDSEIQIEVWMPSTGWNGKLQSVGNGAWAGTISYPALGTAVTDGYAAAGTDTGHTGNNANFVMGHPEKVVDFAYRSVHEMTVAAKAVVAAFYGNAPQRSYWNGCSTGGRQALAEAQRFPNDYDGIVAGAAANYVTHLQGQQVWIAEQAHLEEGGALPAETLALLHQAALEKCDALDGVKDGVIENPKACHFDPKTIACKESGAPHCLTAAQVRLAEKIYAGPKNPRTGKAVFPGLEPGSEAGWNGLAGPEPMALAVETYQYLVHQGGTWDFKTFDADRDVALADKTVAATMNSTDPDLQPFFSHGGKLLMYHGWADPGIAPQNSVNYYTSVVNRLGAAQTADAVRLFMVPGMGHCRGGDGTDTFDAVGALNRWVSTGRAPEQIVASRVRNGATDRTRPLCAYPQVAQYQGTGSTDDAASFACKAP
ncbi:MAG: tannase/feruloyl esterase family alpha/beta hydrolase [Acidobacteriia bacterium]|nr:tannase/feruloyl esterase family alpha/beta hydrolase [Terriglobia bacterium]